MLVGDPNLLQLNQFMTIEQRYTAIFFLYGRYKLFIRYGIFILQMTTEIVQSS